MNGEIQTASFTKLPNSKIQLSDSLEISAMVLPVWMQNSDTKRKPQKKTINNKNS
jgi:hypothetical protein